MALETEIQTYEKHRGELLKDAGKYVLIQGTEVVGVFVAYEDALKAGYEKAGTGPFMVKQIEATEHEKVLYFTRDIEPCRT